MSTRRTEKSTERPIWEETRARKRLPLGDFGKIARQCFEMLPIETLQRLITREISPPWITLEYYLAVLYPGCNQKPGRFEEGCRRMYQDYGKFRGRLWFDMLECALDNAKAKNLVLIPDTSRRPRSYPPKPREWDPIDLEPAHFNLRLVECLREVDAITKIVRFECIAEHLALVWNLNYDDLRDADWIKTVFGEINRANKLKSSTWSAIRNEALGLPDWTQSTKLSMDELFMDPPPPKRPKVSENSGCILIVPAPRHVVYSPIPTQLPMDEFNGDAILYDVPCPSCRTSDIVVIRDLLHSKNRLGLSYTTHVPGEPAPSIVTLWINVPERITPEYTVSWIHDASNPNMRVLISRLNKGDLATASDSHTETRESIANNVVVVGVPARGLEEVSVGV